MSPFFSKKAKWTKQDIPCLKGKLAVVTGAANGMGYEIALGLAQAGADVILVDKNAEAGKIAWTKISSVCPMANIRFEIVDLGNFDSIKNFCSELNSQKKAVDILVNNAAICGVANPKSRLITADGYEAHFGINYLGHFALVAQLLPSLRRSNEARVVNVGSWLYSHSKIKFDDLQMEKGYSSMKAYAKSKLAVMLFSHELKRRSDEDKWGLRVISCHPGTVATAIAFKPGTWHKRIMLRFERLLFQKPCDGALSALFASTAAEAQSGGYYGPAGNIGTQSPVGALKVAATGQDNAVATRLWNIAAELANVKWPSAGS